MKTWIILASLAALPLISRSQDQARESVSPVAGIWRWKFPMPDGSVATPTLRLQLDDGKITGTSSFRAGSETPITNAIYNANGLRFQVVRLRDGRPVTTTYIGQLVGKTLSGSVESDWLGEPRTYPWQAEKLHGPAGSWEWTVAVGERKAEARMSLKQNGAKLEGTVAARARGARPSRVKNGTIDDDGQLSFEIETGPEGARRTTQYKGKLEGDTISGAIETTVNGVVHKTEWLARRVL